jgi:uncharacterized protein YndB with AHSA1/START domain
MTPDMTFSHGTLQLTQVYSAPRAEVFDAWVEIAKVQSWWGCAGTTKVVSRVEPGVGGQYLHDMTVTGAGEMTMGGTITAYDPPARLAFSMRGGPGPEMHVNVEFIDLGGRTEVRLTHTGIPEQFSGFIQSGWSAGLARLEQLLAGTLAAAEG